MQSESSKIRLRDRREPGHFWADNEIFDVFGDELGPNGIGLYMVLARLAMGTTNVRASLRELAALARMSKDTVSRMMQLLVRIGLVMELKPEKARAVSTYSLTNVKELAREYVRSAVRQTVSVGDSAEQADAGATADGASGMTYHEAYMGVPRNCLTRRQTGDDAEAGSVATDSPLCETDLSQNTQNLSQERDTLNKNKKKEKELPPTPRWGDAHNPIPEDVLGKWREDLDAANVFRAKLGDPPLAWEEHFDCEAERYGRLHRPKPAPDAEFAMCATARQAAALMMQRCALSGDGMAKAITEAIELASASGEYSGTVGELGELAWANYRQYQREIPQLRFTWGPRKFFVEGHWLNPQTWPREKQQSRL